MRNSKTWFSDLNNCLPNSHHSIFNRRFDSTSTSCTARLSARVLSSGRHDLSYRGAPSLSSLLYTSSESQRGVRSLIWILSLWRKKEQAEIWLIFLIFFQRVRCLAFSVRRARSQQSLRYLFSKVTMTSSFLLISLVCAFPARRALNL